MRQVMRSEEGAAFTGEIENPQTKRNRLLRGVILNLGCMVESSGIFKKILCLIFLAPLASPPPLYTWPNILIYLVWSVVWVVSFKMLPDGCTLWLPLRNLGLGRTQSRHWGCRRGKKERSPWGI